MRHGFLSLLDGPVTLSLLLGLSLLAFALLLLLFLLTLKLFGPLAFHEVYVQRSDFRLTQKLLIACHEPFHFLQQRLQFLFFLMALLPVGRVFRFKPRLLCA